MLRILMPLFFADCPIYPLGPAFPPAPIRLIRLDRWSELSARPTYPAKVPKQNSATQGLDPDRRNPAAI